MQEEEISNEEVLCINLVNGDVSNKKRLDFNSFDVKINVAPKKSCKKCYGRGWVGHFISDDNEANGLKVPCKCIFRKVFEK